MNNASVKNVLLIAEGAKREPQLMERMFDSFSLADDNEQATQNANECMADLAATVADINHSELLLNEIDRLNNDSFCACCTCLFFIVNWPKRLNDVLNKAIKRGLGIRLF